jgi:hypothetical protein
VAEPATGAGARRPGAVGARGRAPVALTALVAVAAVLLAGWWTARAFPPEHDHDHGSYADAIPVAANEHEGRLVPLRGVGVGACLNDTAVVAGAVRVLSCASPHRFEVFGTADLDEPARPGGEIARAEANLAACEQRLRAGPLRAAADDVTTLLDAVDDLSARPAGRRVVCALGFNDFHQTVGNQGKRGS